MPRLILYQRDDCPLCDQALAVLAAAGVPDFEPVWIDDDAELGARYGERVPVLRDPASGRELDWPFDPDAVHAWLPALGRRFRAHKAHNVLTSNSMKTITWSTAKNAALKVQRGVCFEDVVYHILAGDIIATFEHPNQERYGGQQIHAIQMEGYVYLVPFVESKDEVFLKTIIPSRKATRKYRGVEHE